MSKINDLLKLLKDIFCLNFTSTYLSGKKNLSQAWLILPENYSLPLSYNVLWTYSPLIGEIFGLIATNLMNSQGWSHFFEIL